MIIGTAGHIDHGKTSLVRVLTGVDTDRLQEEKRRGITIDLGFAYHTFGNGARVGFVDVPGHEKLIHTMMTGAASMDFIMLVIAADDGIMPQTREHLEILSLLGQKRGVVALTRIDLVDAAARSPITGQVKAFLAGTFLGDAAVVPVSARTGEGVAQLYDLLGREAAAYRPPPQNGYFRYGIDRVFNLKGKGTIVTGSVFSGALETGAAVVIAPGNITARVRSIHAQDMPVNRARRGDRAALNLTGDMISRDVIKRGLHVVDPFLNQPTMRFDSRVSLLASEKKPLRQWFPVRLHHAAQDMAARLVFLEEESLRPGQTAFVQIVTEKPVIAVTGDRFVVRDTSASRTIGGGFVIDPQPPQRKRRTAARLLRLAAMAEQDPALALHKLLQLPPCLVDWQAFCRARNLDEATARSLLDQADAISLQLGQGAILLERQHYETLQARICDTLTAFHSTEPDLPGMGLEKLRRETAPDMQALPFREVLAAEIRAGRLKISGAWVALAAHSVRLSPKDQQIWEQVEPVLLGVQRFRPPRTRDFARSLTVNESDMRRILKSVARMGKAYEVAQDYFFPGAVLHEIVGILQSIVEEKPENGFIAADLRDRLDNGRKISILILEFFDSHGLTIRKGDIRRLNTRRLELFRPGGDDGQKTVL